MSGFYTKLEEETLGNNNFRKVLFTGEHSQLVVMSLRPGEDIGMEVHGDIDQFIRVDGGVGKAIIGEEEFSLEDGDAIVVPAGERHNLINISEDEALKLYTIYSPAEHEEGTIHETRREAMEAEEHHN